MKTVSSKLLKVKHGFFNREGGVSGGHYKSLNCSLKVGDNEKDVIKNLNLVQDFLQADKLFTLNQVHGNTCIVVDENTTIEPQIIDADGLITNMPNIALGVITADCAPVLLHSEDGGYIGALHCGWKSTHYGLIENAINHLRTLGCSKISAAIGPCVQAESYPVKEDFVHIISEQILASEINNFFVKLSKDTYLFDLSKYIKYRLQRLNVTDIEDIGIDTLQDKSFFSFRRAQKLSDGVCGRQISCIVM